MKRLYTLMLIIFAMFIFVSCDRNGYNENDEPLLTEHIAPASTTPAHSPIIPVVPPPNPEGINTNAWPPPTAQIQLSIDPNGTISAATITSMAIDAEGVLWSWGRSGTFGLLGAGEIEEALRPIGIMENVAYVNVNSAMAQAIDAYGGLWQWGMFINEASPLNQNIQTNIPFRATENIAMVDFGQNVDFYLLTMDGEVRSWSYATGRSDHDFTQGPIDVTRLAEAIPPIWTFSPGRILTGIRQFSTNSNSFTRAFVTYDHELHILSDIIEFPGTQPTDGSIKSNVARVSAGSGLLLILTNDGRLYAFGDNTDGQVGTGSDAWRYREIQFIMDNIAHIYAGINNAFAITLDGRLYAWGNNSGGKLGDGTAANRRYPTFIMDNVNNVAAGSRHTLAITNDGRLYGWGENRAGQLGQGEGGGGFYHSPVFIMDGMRLVERS